MDCIFCKLANREIETEVVYEDERVFAFRDMDPKAPIHYLFIPKEHISTLNDLEGDQVDASVITDLFRAISHVAKRDGFADSGYRVVSNCGADGGQTVQHIHFHVLAGRELLWPAG